MILNAHDDPETGAELARFEFAPAQERRPPDPMPKPRAKRAEYRCGCVYIGGRPVGDDQARAVRDYMAGATDYLGSVATEYVEDLSAALAEAMRESAA
jgi:hypothetical protein